MEQDFLIKRAGSFPDRLSLDFEKFDEIESTLKRLAMESQKNQIEISKIIQIDSDFSKFMQLAQGIWARTLHLERSVSELTQSEEFFSLKRVKQEVEHKFSILKKQLKELSIENAGLKKSFQTENTNLKKTLESYRKLESHCRRLNEEIQNQHSKIKELARDKQDLASRLQTLQSRFEEIINARDETSQAHAKARDELIRFKTMSTAQQEEIARLRAENKNNKVDHNEFLDLRQSHAENLRLISDLKAKSQSLMNSLLTEGKARKQLQEELVQAEGNSKILRELEAKNHQLARTLKDAQVRADRLASIVDHQNEDIENLREINTILQARLSQNGKVIMEHAESKKKKLETTQ